MTSRDMRVGRPTCDCHRLPDIQTSCSHYAILSGTCPGSCLKVQVRHRWPDRVETSAELAHLVIRTRAGAIRSFHVRGRWHLTTICSTNCRYVYVRNAGPSLPTSGRTKSGVWYGCCRQRGAFCALSGGKAPQGLGGPARAADAAQAAG